ncbi:MAG TPA: hypothetical protein VGV89_01580 [Thermoplasmata archaeon]|nr:hypothetical protein [Thermoplasmata archaeon]
MKKGSRTGRRTTRAWLWDYLIELSLLIIASATIVVLAPHL